MADNNEIIILGGKYEPCRCMQKVIDALAKEDEEKEEENDNA